MNSSAFRRSRLAILCFLLFAGAGLLLALNRPVGNAVAMVPSDQQVAGKVSSALREQFRADASARVGA